MMKTNTDIQSNSSDMITNYSKINNFINNSQSSGFSIIGRSMVDEKKYLI
jgi:hypothetical protein